MDHSSPTDSIRPPTWVIFVIGLGLFAAQFAWVIYNTYVPIYLQAGGAQFEALTHSAARQASVARGFGLNAVQTGLIMSLDNIAAFLLQPLSGLLSDGTRSRLGRRKPYLLAGMPVAALGLSLIPLVPLGIPAAMNGDVERLSGLFAVWMACLLGMVIAMACWRAPLFALMADLTPSVQRSQANGILNLMAGLGGILAFVIGAGLYSLYSPLPFWLAALILLGAAAAIFWLVKEPARAAQTSASPQTPFGLSALRAELADLPKDQQRSLALLSAAVFFYMLGFHPIEAFFSSYGVTTLGLSASSSGLVLSAAYITFILFAVPSGLLAGRLGRRRIVLGGLLLFATVLLIGFFTPFVKIMVVLLALGGLAWALIDIHTLPMILDTLGGAGCVSEQASGAAAAIYFIATTLAATLGPILNGWLIDLAGRNYSMIFLIGPLFFLLSFVCMGGVRHGEIVR